MADNMGEMLLLSVIVCLLVPTESAGTGAPQYRLYQHLFTNYSTSVRPAAQYHTPTMVEFEISIYNLIDLNEKTQVMTINAELIMKWNDSFLLWNPTDFEGIEDIRVPWKDIWTPDVVLYNSADSAYEFAIYNTLAIVKSSGEVTMLSHAILRSSCEINIRYYPFDQQLCVMSFSSWSQDITQIRLRTGPAEGDISAYVPNPEFFLENFYVDSLNTTDACCENPFSTLRYNVQLQRRTAFSMFFFIMPGVFVNLTALMVFILPCESGEKISLGISSMLAMMVFLMAMTENLPPTQTIPIAGTYYGTCIGVLTANIMASIIVLNIQYKGVWGFPVPNWLRVVMFDVLARILFISVPARIRQTQVSPGRPSAPSSEAWGPVANNGKAAGGDQYPQRPRTGRAVRDDGFIKRPSQRELEELAAKVLGPATTLQVLTDANDLHDTGARSSMRDLLERIEAHMAARTEQDSLSEVKAALGEEWRLVAYVIDRLSGIVFLVVTIIFNFVILLSSPEVSKFEYCRGPPGSCTDV